MFPGNEAPTAEESAGASNSDEVGSMGSSLYWSIGNLNFIVSGAYKLGFL